VIGCTMAFVAGALKLKTRQKGLCWTQQQQRSDRRIAVGMSGDQWLGAAVAKLAEVTEAVGAEVPAAVEQTFQQPSSLEKWLATSAIVLAVYSTVLAIILGINNARTNTMAAKELKELKARVKTYGNIFGPSEESSGPNRDQRRMKKKKKKDKRATKEASSEDSASQ